MMMVYFKRKVIAYSETSISTVSHYEKVLKASDVVYFTSTQNVRRISSPIKRIQHE